jgi:CubicO group peptidase (beta-lactamase class C family)
MLPLLALAACAERQTFPDPIPVDDTFPRAAPAPDALARFEAADAYSTSRRGRAMLVLQGDTVVFEAGENGHSLDEPGPLYSGTKSFACAAALAARDDGLLDLDAPAADTLTEWRGDADKEAIRVSDLLHFTSGLKDDFWKLTYDGLIVDQKVDDKYAVAVAEPTTFEPGSAFRYNGTDLLVFGEVLTRVTREDPLSYLQAKVLDPIGFRTSGWSHDPSGNPMMAYGAWTTVNEWAKFGRLVRDDPRYADCRHGSDPMPAYGLNFWLNAELTADQAALVPTHPSAGRLIPEAPDDLFMAAGARDQRLYVIPSLDLVIVRLGDGGMRWDDRAFVARVLCDDPEDCGGT